MVVHRAARHLWHAAGTAGLLHFWIVDSRRNVRHFFKVRLCMDHLLIELCWGQNTARFVPALLIGACYGRALGLMIATFYNQYPNSQIFSYCSTSSKYALLLDVDLF